MYSVLLAFHTTLMPFTASNVIGRVHAPYMKPSRKSSCDPAENSMFTSPEDRIAVSMMSGTIRSERISSEIAVSFWTLRVEPV
jgi:hypothetical protein